MTPKFMKPITRYTKSGRLNIAYQSFGSGSIDLVYVPGWVSNIDLMWACPELVYFFKELGKITRVILFDKRGTGLSDRITELEGNDQLFWVGNTDQVPQHIREFISRESTPQLSQKQRYTTGAVKILSEQCPNSNQLSTTENVLHP